jgi:hypothetical protein
VHRELNSINIIYFHFIIYLYVVLYGYAALSLTFGKELGLRTFNKKLFFMSIERDYVSELRPLNRLLLLPQIVYKYGDSRFNDTDRGNRRTWKKNVPVPL